eukprot:s1478_g11.t1
MIIITTCSFSHPRASGVRQLRRESHGASQSRASQAQRVEVTLPADPGGAALAGGEDPLEMLETAEKRLERTFLKRGDGSFLEEVSSRFHQLDTSAAQSQRALGVTRLLQRILDDVKLELQEAETTERKAEAEYRGFLKDPVGLEDAAAKRSEEKFALVQKRTQKATLAAELQNSKVLHAATKKEELAVDKDCEWLLKSWKDRVGARDREVEALRQARATLNAQASSQELSLASLVVISVGAIASFGWMQLAWVVKKLSMVDVMCMGVLVVTLCFSMYRKYVLVEMGLGQWLLVGAEVIHYFLYYTVKGVIEVTEKVDLGNTVKGDEETDISSDESNGSSSDSEAGTRVEEANGIQGFFKLPGKNKLVSRDFMVIE